MQGEPGQKGPAGDVGPAGPVGPDGKDGIGPPPAPAFVEPGDWPKGGCVLMTPQCVALGVADNLCGECAPVCDRCDADVGFKLVSKDGLRFGAGTFDEKSLAKGSVQVRGVLVILMRRVSLLVLMGRFVRAARRSERRFRKRTEPAVIPGAAANTCTRRR